MGCALRLFSVASNREFARGDVVMDAAIAQSLARGLGFWIPWEEGSALYDDPVGTGLSDFGHPSDSHGPLWPLLGAPLVWILGSGYAALQALSWICGVLSIVAARVVFRRFAIGEAQLWAGEIAAWGCALSLGLCDYSGNGSLYAGQVLGVLLLPLVVGSMDSTRRAVFSGLLLGALYLLSYQLALLILVFAAAVAWNLGIRRALKPLVVSGIACLTVTVPWFVRNYLTFGDPFFTTNPAFFAAKSGAFEIDFAASRPMARILANPSAPRPFSWVTLNAWLTIGLLPVAVPVFQWFAAGGFWRMLRAPKETRLAGQLVAGTFVVLFATAIICPQPRTRHLIGMVPILTGVAALELTHGARLLPALLTVAGSVAGLWQSYYIGNTFLQRDYFTLAPWALLPLTYFVGRSAPKLAARVVPIAALVALAGFGALRVYLSLDLAALQAWYVGPAPGTQVAPIARFYDYLDGPWEEPKILVYQRDLARVVADVRYSGANLLYADVMASPAWPHRFLSSRGRVEWNLIPGIVKFFGVDAIIVPTPYADRSGTRVMLGEMGATTIAWTDTYTAFRIPSSVR